MQNPVSFGGTKEMGFWKNVLFLMSDYAFGDRQAIAALGVAKAHWAFAKAPLTPTARFITTKIVLPR